MKKQPLHNLSIQQMIVNNTSFTEAILDTTVNQGITSLSKP